MTAEQRIKIIDITKELANLRKRQTTELRNLVTAHRIEEREFFDRLYETATDIGYENENDTNSEGTEQGDDVAQAPESTTQNSTATSTFVRASLPHDENHRTLFVGDRVRVLTKGKNNNEMDAARVLAINDKRDNWITIKIDKNNVVTHRSGSNLQVIQ